MYNILASYIVEFLMVTNFSNIEIVAMTTCLVEKLAGGNMEVFGDFFLQPVKYVLGYL